MRSHVEKRGGHVALLVILVGIVVLLANIADTVGAACALVGTISFGVYVIKYEPYSTWVKIQAVAATLLTSAGTVVAATTGATGAGVLAMFFGGVAIPLYMSRFVLEPDMADE